MQLVQVGRMTLCALIEPDEAKGLRRRFGVAKGLFFT